MDAITVRADGSSTGWSSIIGIITAIIGNILISFALNTQRYAHVRLEREQQEEKEKTLGLGAARERGADVAIEVQIAEERSRENARSDTPRGQLDHDFEGHEGTETDALIPHIKAPEPQRKGSEDGNANGNGSLKEHPNGSENDEHVEDDDDEPKRKSYLRSPYWWLGISLMVVGEAGNFLAYGFAPASIVSPLGVVALVSNCLVAPIMLGEKFRRRDLLGVVIAVGGAVTVVLSAQGSNPKLGPDEILKLVSRWEFLTYMGITIGFIVVLMFLSNRIGSRFIVVDLGLVGLFGGYTALSTKGVASLLSYRLFRALTFPIFYVLVVVLVGTAVLQIKYVNRALQRFDSTRVIPTQFCIFTIFVIIGSAVLYRDFESTTGDKVGMFVGGCALTFLGVWFLTSGRRSGDDDKDTHNLKATAGDEENRIDLVDDESSEGTATPKASTSTYASANSTMKSLQTTDSNNSFHSALSSRPAMHTATSTPAPLALQHTVSDSTGATESSPLLARTPGTPSSQQRRRSELLTPNTPGRSGGLTPTQSTPGANPPRSPLVSRESINRFGRGFGTSGFGPLTGTLSGGLSVVVADQRGRMARGASGAGSGARRESAVDSSVARERWGSIDAGAAGSPRVSERPRVGRGTTVEVAGSTRPGSPGREGTEDEGGGGGGSSSAGKARSGDVVR